MGFESSHAKPENSPDSQKGYANPMDWMGKNIVNPVWNTLCAEPASAIVNAINFASQKVANTDILAKVELAEVGEEQPGSVGSYVQQIASGLACVLPYAKAGKLAGFGLRGVSRTAKMEKWCTVGSKIVGSEKTAQIFGAAVYDGLKNTRGEETHLSNAVGGAASFTVYEMLNPKLRGLAKLNMRPGKLGVIARMGAHGAGLFGIGAAGSMAHEEASHFTRTGQFVDLKTAGENSVQGGVMNILLPATQHALGKAIDRVNQKVGRGTPMDRFRQEMPESVQQSPTVKQFIAENPLARVQRVDGKDCYVDHDRHIVYYGKEAPVSEFIHELSHLMSERDPQQKALYKSVDVLDKQGKTAEADAAYISARAASEIRARQIGEQVARECGLSSETKNWTAEAIGAEKLPDGTTYLEHWMQERRQLQAAGKATRADMDYSVLAGQKPAEISFEDRVSKLQDAYKASGGIFPNKAEAHANIIRELQQTIENSGTYSVQHKETLHKLLNIFVDALSDTNNLYSVAAKYRNENKRFDGVYDTLVEHGPAQALWEISKSTLRGSRKETLLLDMAIATNGKIGDFISNPEAVQKILETIDVKQIREKREAYHKAGLLNWDINHAFAPKRAGEILQNLGVGPNDKHYQKALDVLGEIVPVEKVDVMTDKQFQNGVNWIVGYDASRGTSSENWRSVLQAITPERIANLSDNTRRVLVDRISQLKEKSRQDIRQLTIDEVVYGPADTLVERVVGSGIERIKNISELSHKHFIDAENAEKIREIMKHTFEYVGKLPDVQKREAQFEILRGLVKEGVLQKVNCTNEELQLLVSSLDKCSNRMRGLPQSEQADIIIDMVRELALRNEMHDAELTEKTIVNAINAIDPEIVSVIANKATDVVPVIREVLKANQKEQWIKNGLGEAKCRWIFDEVSSVVRRSLRRPLASDKLIDSIFNTYTEGERAQLKEALAQRADYLSVDRVFAQFQELAGALRNELKDNQASQGINEPVNTFIYAKHEPGRRDVQAINVLCQSESTVGHALAHLFRKVTGISVNIQVIGKDGKVPDGNWITFEPTDFNPNLKTTDGLPTEIDQHIAQLRKFGDGINFLDLYRGEALGSDKSHEIDHLYRKLDSILHPGISKVELEKRAYERFCSQDDHLKLSVQEIESLKDALSPYDLINQDVRTIQALMFLRDRQRAKSNPLAPEDAIRYVSRYTSQITYSRMFEQARNAMARLKDAFGEQDTNKFLFVTDIDNGGSTHLTTYLFRLANGLEAADHLFVGKKDAQEAVKQARENGQAAPILVYVDDYTYTGTQIAKFHAKDMVELGPRTAAVVLGAFDHGREAVINSMNAQGGERKFVVGDQYLTINQVLQKGVNRFFEGRFRLPNSYCSPMVVPYLHHLLNKPLKPNTMRVLVEGSIENVEKVLSAIGGSEWDKTNKKNQEKQLRKKAKNGKVDAQQLENSKDSGTEIKPVTGLILPHFVPNNAPELFSKLFVDYFGYARADGSKEFPKPYLESKSEVESKQAADYKNSEAVNIAKKRSNEDKQSAKEAALANFDGTVAKKSVGSSKGSDKGPEFVMDGLYRKGAIRSDKAMVEAKESGIESIVDLQFEKDPAEKKGKFDERESANKNGITYLNKGISPTEVTVEQLQDAINTVEEARQNGPVLVHCTRGLDRTGAVIAAMRIKVDGVSLEQALDEMRAHMVTMKHPEVFEVVRDWYISQHPESRQQILDWYERRFADDYAAIEQQSLEKKAARADKQAAKVAEQKPAQAKETTQHEVVEVIEQTPMQKLTDSVEVHVQEKHNWKDQITKSEGIELIPGIKVHRLTADEAKLKNNSILRDAQIVLYRKDLGLKVTLDRQQLGKAARYAQLFREMRRRIFNNWFDLPEGQEEILQSVARAVGRS